jgi:hypothetical protein
MSEILIKLTGLWERTRRGNPGSTYWVGRFGAAKILARHVLEAIALVPARVDTEWFRLLEPFPCCFIYGRLIFDNAENPAPFPSAIVYLGRNVHSFAKVFGQIGGI